MFFDVHLFTPLLYLERKGYNKDDPPKKNNPNIWMTKNNDNNEISKDKKTILDDQ